MFPLGTVLLPGTALPLHVFEPRYRVLARHVTEGDGRFGVVLIERGSEVGGGEERVGVGTVAVIRQAEEFADGRWGLVAVGSERLKVVSWLDDDPYPRADVDVWPDEVHAGEGLDARPSASAVGEVAALMAEIARLARQLGHDVPDPSTGLGADPEVALWSSIASAPLGPADRQALLECAGAEERARKAAAMLEDQRQTLAALVAEKG